MRPKLWFAGLVFIVALAATESRAARTSCPNIVGNWQSWAAGLFGQGDTTFRSNGTAVHRSGITGTWKCSGGKIEMSWGGGAPEFFTLQDNKLINSAGGAGFSREGGPKAAREPAGGEQKRTAPSKQKVAEAPQKTPSRTAEKNEPAPLVEPRNTRLPAMVSSDRASFADKLAAEFGMEYPRRGPEDDSDGEICGFGESAAAISACTREMSDIRKWTSGPRDWTLSMTLDQRSRLYATKGAYDLAIKDITEAIRLAPGWVPYYNYRGQLYGLNGDYDLAMRDFTKAIELVPDFSAAYYNRGQTYAAKKSYDLAIVDFSAAIAYDPKYTLAFHMRGKAYLAKNDFARALADYSEAIRISPDDAEACRSRGDVYASQRDFGRAQSDYAKAINLDPNAPDYYVSRATLNAAQGDNDLVIADLNQAIKLDPRRAEFYLLRGNAWIGKGDDERAQRDFDAAIALDPNNDANVAAMAWSLEGQIRYVRGDAAAATQYYDRAVRFAPKSAPLYIARGAAWHARGEYNRAIRDYTEAIRLQPDSQSAYFARGLSYFGQGDFVLAAEDFAELKGDPNDLHGLLWYHLAKERAGSTDSREELARIIAPRKSDAWPAPIFQMFLGQRTSDAVLAAAINAQQRCEARFYGGERQLLQAARAAAAQAFHAMATDCPLTSIERLVAADELRRMEGQHESR